MPDARRGAAPSLRRELGRRRHGVSGSGSGRRILEGRRRASATGLGSARAATAGQLEKGEGNMGFRVWEGYVCYCWACWAEVC